MQILDLAIDVIQYRFVKETIDKPTYRKQLLKALSTRSKLGKSKTDINADISRPPLPEQGHDSARIGIGGGISNRDDFFDIRWRPVFTDLLDMDYIHHQGAQIEFVDLRCRYYPEKHRFALEQVDFIDIVSISPRDSFFKPFSWKFNTGFQRKPMPDKKESLFYRIDAGGGLAARYPYLGLSYAMAEAAIDIGGAMPDNFAVGAGGEIGTIRKILPNWKIRLYIRMLRFAIGDTHAAYGAGWNHNIKLSRNHQMNVEFEWDKIRAISDTRAAVLWHWYY